MISQGIKPVRVSLAVLALLFVASAVSAQDVTSSSGTSVSSAAGGAAVATAPEAGDDASTRVVCKQTTPLGTRFAKKTCKTVAEWDELRRMGNEAARTGAEQSRMIREAPPGG